MTMADTVAVMRAGRLEQVGAPADLYDHPATTFVANFLGQSNLLPLEGFSDPGGEFVTAHAHGIGLVVERAQLPAGMVVRAQVAAVDSAVHLGIRPEKLRILGPNDPPSANRLGGLVTDASFNGVATTYLVSMPWGQELTVTRPNDGSPRAQRGDEVTLGWDPNQAFVLAEAD